MAVSAVAEVNAASIPAVPPETPLPDPLIHVPPIEKHPVARLRPLPNVEVALCEVMLSAVACKPDVNVDVAPELKVKALLVPLIASAAVVEVAVAVLVAR